MIRGREKSKKLAKQSGNVARAPANRREPGRTFVAMIVVAPKWCFADRLPRVPHRFRAPYRESY
ncbi:hypothetical protein STUTZSP0542_27730 [Stutzerimonas marianensis]